MLELGNLKGQLDRLRLYHIKANLESIVHKSQIDKLTNLDFLKYIMEIEIQYKDKRDYERRLKSAHLPTNYNLENFDYNFGGITKHQLDQLKELVWIENAYNLILMGPSGTGKTFIAAGLIYQAVKMGYKAYLITMEELVNIIRNKSSSVSAMQKYNRLLNAHLVAIDDIMLFPVKREEANDFFNLINTLHEKA